MDLTKIDGLIYDELRENGERRASQLAMKVCIRTKNRVDYQIIIARIWELIGTRKLGLTNDFNVTGEIRETR